MPYEIGRFPFMFLKNMLNLLIESFQKGYEYHPTTGFRSELSTYHELIFEISVGQNGRNSSVLSGTFNNLTSQHKFNYIWDFEKLLDYFLNQDCDWDLSLGFLTLKLIMFLNIFLNIFLDIYDF